MKNLSGTFLSVILRNKEVHKKQVLSTLTKIDTSPILSEAKRLTNPMEAKESSLAASSVTPEEKFPKWSDRNICLMSYLQ